MKDNIRQKNSVTSDVIVVGVGSMGSSACYHLAKQGLKVLGLEQFDITHEFGSHAGQSRIIRKAYFEHPDYVPLLERAYDNWKYLQEETGEQIYFKTGLLYAGKPEKEMLKGIKLAASIYNIELQSPGAEEVKKKFPQFKFPDAFEILFEPDAGFLRPEMAIRLYADRAIKHGAIIKTREKVLNWKRDGKGVNVTTDKNVYQAKKLVITAGAWSGKMIPGFADKIKVTRQFVAWIKPKRKKNFLLNNFPCWMVADEKGGCYYGFPVLSTDKFGPPEGLKLAHHLSATITDPDNVNREATNEDMGNLQYCLEKYLPGTFDGVLHDKVCLYGNSPDENFIIDKLPEHETNMVIACGFSGHGFKFIPVVGEILADLIIKGETDLPIGFLSAKRFK